MMGLSRPPSNVTHWSCDMQKPPVLTRCYLIWVDHNHRVTWLIYHRIMLYSRKGASPVSQHQCPSNLVGLWLRVKWSQLLFQVTCRSSDHVLFEKRHVSTKARLQDSSEDIKHRKATNQKLFCYSKDINTWFASTYTSLKISKLCR